MTANDMPRILLVAPTSTSDPVAAALRQELFAQVDLVANRRAAIAALQRSDFHVVILDESVTVSDPEGSEQLYHAAADTPVLEINFTLCNAARAVRQVRATLFRRAQDRAQAQQAVAAKLHSEIGSTVTGLLLESELALREAGPDQRPKLRHVVELASGLRDRLRA